MSPVPPPLMMLDREVGVFQLEREIGRWGYFRD